MQGRQRVLLRQSNQTQWPLKVESKQKLPFCEVEAKFRWGVVPVFDQAELAIRGKSRTFYPVLNALIEPHWVGIVLYF
jgi:hypothetical protein